MRAKHRYMSWISGSSRLAEEEVELIHSRLDHFLWRESSVYNNDSTVVSTQVGVMIDGELKELHIELSARFS